jgi:outer membrane receptor protein involved in Fe transport
MRSHTFWRLAATTSVALGWSGTLGGARALAQQPAPPQPDPQQHIPPTVAERVVVSATRVPEIETEIPGQATVITGEELRRRNARTLADALQDVVGLDAGGGSDNGPRLPSIGIWGLKEFDAFLVMVDGVPAGGPFNPSLSQINVEDIERIEIVKGPQGTLYGVAAFAGMIQVFTRSADKGTEARLSGGSFSEGRAYASHNVAFGSAKLRLFGSFDRSHGWQDRTDYRDDRGGFRLDAPVGKEGSFTLTFDTFRNTQFFGSPLPVDPPTGETIPGFRVDRNYAVDGARLDHRVYATTARVTQPLSSALRLENVLSFTRDDQISIRSFISGVDGNQATAAGVALKPLETDIYDDLHVVADFQAAGKHRLVGGAALTWGRTTAEGAGFDIGLQIDPVVVPRFADTPPGDHRSFRDRRTFFGLYVNDEWTPIRFLTVTGGARYDRVSENLFAQGQEVSAPQAAISNDARSEGQWSGGAAALGRIVEDRPGTLNEVHAYVSAKSAFKPAAPNLTEAENAKILDPERARSGELGIKTRWLDRQISFDVSLFHMIFENLVVSIVGPDGNPELVNAGSQRFQGMEVELGFHPAALPDFHFSAGYAHHDARYIRFRFIDPDNGLTVADGQRLELVPRDVWNASASYAPVRGFGVWAALRHQSRRPFDKINEAYMPPFYGWDAGVSFSLEHARVSLVGRNLSDSQHFVAESEIGDAQLYVAPPRRFTAELAVRF